MIGVSVAFLGGVLFVATAPALPDPAYSAFLPLLFPVLWYPRTRLICVFLCGCLWAGFRAQVVLTGWLPQDLEGRDLVLSGRVISISAAEPEFSRFTIRVENALASNKPVRLRGDVRLSWYSDPGEVVAGSLWSATVRLKRPRGFANPGGFDYERWLFTQGIVATGYVRGNAQSRPGGQSRLDGLRARISGAIGSALPNSAQVGPIKALAVGAKDEISDAQWKVFRNTGTVHLMAISGLHIGLVSGMVFFLTRRLYSLLLPNVGTAQRVAAIAAIAAAAVYAALAGFSTPTQRALVMVIVAMLALISGRRLALSAVVGVALLAVLILDPFAVLAPGFWLSFFAVGLIAYLAAHRSGARGPWWRWGRVHLWLALGIAPLTLGFFASASLIAPIANVVAVPWAGFLVVPLVLAGATLSQVNPAWAAPLLQGADISLDLLWRYLEFLSRLQWTYELDRPPGPMAVVAATVGVAVLLMPKGFAARWLGALWCLPMLFPRVDPIPQGRYVATILDVGQGLSVVVRTSRKVLVFDTGPTFGANFDAAEAVILPYLKVQGVSAVDKLFISHGDSDHAGGAGTLLSGIEVKKVQSNAPGLPGSGHSACRFGQTWVWDGVVFEILHPANKTWRSRNNRSCVLRVTAANGVGLLIPGDAESIAEQAIVRRLGARLRSHILVAGHHGSATSSSQIFLDAVRPRLAVVSAGYRNRYGFPHPVVMGRFEERGMEVLHTARGGAVRIDTEGPGGTFRVATFRQLSPRFWRPTPVDRVRASH